MSSFTKGCVLLFYLLDVQQLALGVSLQRFVIDYILHCIAKTL
jgi:hypothetical protein